MHLSQAGWSAFDRKHREKQENGKGIRDLNKIFSHQMESSKKLISQVCLGPIQSVASRSFSSVVQPLTRADFPPLKVNTELETSNSIVNAVEMLKDAHSWADYQLIDDILAAVNNDMEQAFILLEEMASSEIKNENKQPVMSNWSDDADFLLEKDITLAENDLSNNSQKELTTKQLYAPTEPNWEEDDVYLSRRKEALKMTRAASQHSRSASNAYLRGDHLSAQHFSSRAREEWLVAERLNARAADEILRIRNDDNDIWKLDLHGLHAAEAVHALKQYLGRVEYEMNSRYSASPLDELKAPTIGKVNAVPQQKRALLHVITGTGNHSKGEAALPAAIKCFLIEGGYRFEDERPGVISVRPMFRFQ